MRVERTDLDDGTDGLGYALVELVGKCSFIADDWKGLGGCWQEEDNAVIMSYFSWKLERFAI